METGPVLETARLRLRPLRRDDAVRIQQMFPVWDVVRYLNAVVPWPYPDDGAVQFLDRALAQYPEQPRYLWAMTIAANADDLLIGIIELTPNDPSDSRGFWLAVEYRRRGYMTEAAAAVTDFAFDTLGMQRLLLNNAEPNVGSHRLKEKAGATIIRIVDDVAFVGGRFRQVCWELTRDQWAANRQAFLG